MKSSLYSLLIIMGACNSDDGIKAYNSQPQVTITSHSNSAEIQDGYIVSFVGQVSDANHQNSELIVTWSTNNGELCSNLVPEDNGETICDAVLVESDTEIRLQAIDPEGGAGVHTIDITILPTKAPTAEIISPLPSGVYYSDQKITFEGFVQDEEDPSEQLVAVWESDIDGELDIDTEINSAGTTLGYGYLSQGEHAIELYVEDTTEKSDTTSVIINVGPPNSAPLCEITAPVTISSGPENQNIDFYASVSDVDIPSDLLTVTWTSDKDGTLGTSTPNSSGDVLFSYSLLSVNTHTVTMTVTDEIGTSCTDFISYTVGTPPEITLNTPMDGDVFSEGSSITFSATVSDAQDQPNEVSLDWQLNGVSISTQRATPSGTASWSDSSLPLGNHTLIVTATDTDGLYDSTQTMFTINGIPSAPEISITPDPATTSDQLTANIDVASVDPENSTISYSYEWYKNNILQSTYTSATISSSETTKDDTWKVRITPNDGMANGTTAEAQITISNTSPEITATINVSGSGNSAELTCVGVASDVDDSIAPSITYEWLDDAGSSLGTANPLQLDSTMGTNGDNISCIATATDNDGESSTETAVHTITNTPPTAPSISLSPNSPVAGQDDLICSVILPSSDDDGDAVVYTYVWTDDSGVIQQTTTESTASSDTFLASGTSEGTWTCEVTPYDMTDYGTSDSASIAIVTGANDIDGDGFYDWEDCDDNDASLNLSDTDGDGVTSCDGDCDDNDASRSPDLSEVCDGIDNDCDGSIPTSETDVDGNGVIDCAEGWSTTGYSVKDFDVSHDGSITAVSFNGSTGDIHALCFDTTGVLSNVVLIETVNLNLYRSNEVRVARAGETQESAIGWNFRSRYGQDWRSRHAHLDENCEIVAPAAKLDIELGSGLLRRVSVEIDDYGTSAFVYENQTEGEFRLLYFDETGTLINALNFGSSECGTGALTRVLGMNRSNGDVIVGCESSTPGQARYYQRFDSTGNTIDTAMTLVPNASNTGSWHNFQTQMNDDGEFVYLAATSSGWIATFYDASGIEVSSVQTGIYNQSDKIITTSNGDFVLGGTSNREIYSSQGTLLGSSSAGGKIRLDGSDVVYDISASSVYNPFPLY